MPSGYENRRFMRSPVDLPITLTLTDGLVIEGRLRNVSILGLYAETLDLAPAGAQCEVTFFAAPLKEVKLSCEVMHRNPTGMGMKIVGIESETFENLRELIVNHAQDPARSDREILSNMGELPLL